MQLAGVPVLVDDLDRRRGQRRTDALIFTGDGIRVAVRPSGTEPKIKCYLEVSAAPSDDLFAARAHTAGLMRAVKEQAAGLLGA